MTTPASLLHSEAFLSPLAIDEAVQRALDEDLGRAGDITSIATIPEKTPARAIMIARQAGVIAGLPLAVATFQKLSPDIKIEAHVRDGAAVAKGAQVLTISGSARGGGGFGGT
jgi:nicotinate-nucleotide pyrophosphorylase (carboxylating)